MTTAQPAVPDFDRLRVQARAFLIAVCLANRQVQVTRCQHIEGDSGGVWELETERGQFWIPAAVVAGSDMDSVVAGMLTRGLFWTQPAALKPLRRKVHKRDGR